MRTVSYRIGDLGKATIHIGRVAENDYTRVQIDAGEIYAEFPNASVALTVQPPSGAAYPAVVTREGNLVVWDVPDSALTEEGMGEIQLTFTSDEVVVKSAIGRISVCRSIVGDGEVPDPLDDFLAEAGAALTAIPETINAALAEAKASGEFDGPKGDKGDPGDPGGPPGKDFTIAKTFASVSAMLAYTGTDIEEHEFALINSTDADNGKLFQYEPNKNLLDLTTLKAPAFAGQTYSYSLTATWDGVGQTIYIFHNGGSGGESIGMFPKPRRGQSITTTGTTTAEAGCTGFTFSFPSGVEVTAGSVTAKWIYVGNLSTSMTVPIDDTAGTGVTNKVWSANKSASENSALLSALQQTNTRVETIEQDYYGTESINLFNPNDPDVIQNGYIDASGTQQSLNWYWESGYIPCEKDDTFTFTIDGEYVSSGKRTCVFYNENKTFLSGSDYMSLPTLTIHVNCAYFRITLKNSEFTGNLMIVKNDTSLHPYVPYGTGNGFKDKVNDELGYILYPNETTPKADRSSEIISVLNKYGECVLAKGDFYASAITMPTGTKLSGKGMCSRLIMLETTATGTLITPSGNNTIADLSIEREGGYSTRPSSGTNGEDYGITCANNVNQIRITNCDFKGFKGAGVYGYGSSSNDTQSAFIDNCRFLFCTTGIWFYGGMEYNSVSNCCCSGCYYGVRNEGGNNLFTSCHFDKNYNAFELRSSSVSPANFGHSSLVGCTFNHSVAYAVYFLGGDNGTVFSGCQIWYGVIYLRAVDGISFSACEFGGNGSVPISFYGTACKGNRFTDCTFNDAPSITLEGSATSDAYIVNDCYMMDGTPVSFAS